MAVKTQDGVTTLTPTSWMWFAGAAAIAIILPGFGLLLALFFVLIGAGVAQRLTLSKRGITVRNWFSNKFYAWDEIDDFRIYKVKSGLITAANMVSFTHASKDGTMMGKAAKFLVGGTHSIPAVGMPAKKLIHLMQAYKMGIVPGETEAAAMPEPRKPAVQSPHKPAFIAPATASKPRRTVAVHPPARKPVHKASTPLVQEGGGLFGRRRSDSPFGS